MKKITFFFISVIACLAMVSCSSKDSQIQGTDSGSEQPSSSVSEENNTGLLGVPNPVVDYEDLARINEAVGCNLVHPPVMGVSDETFCVIGGTLAQYELKVNGVEYNFRAAKRTDDITGIYVENGTLTDKLLEFDAEEGVAVNICGYNVARWFVGDMQYTLTSQDETGEMLDTFRTFVEEARSLQR